MAWTTTDVLRYHVLWFCDLDSLLRLNHTHRCFRTLLNDPAVVSEWMTLCWYLQPRHCRCEREQYLVDLERWCPFMWDFRGGDTIRVEHTATATGNQEGVANLREMQLVLRSLGRSLPMLLQTVQRPLAVPRLRYPHECQDFCPGMHEDLLDGLLIPLPRMVHCPVECTRTQVEGNHGVDAYWEGWHEITDADLEEHWDVKVAKRELPPPSTRTPPTRDTSFSYDPSVYVDQVTAYKERCRLREEPQDPHDPNEDTELMEGYKAEQWARRLLYESAVGLQTFPLRMCVHRDDLVGLAHRLGPMYIERRFVSVMAYEGHRGESELLGLKGVGLFYNVRYDNEGGDFHSWCLSTMATLNATYHHLWHDYVRLWLRSYRVYLMNLAQEIQEDLPMSQLCPRWRRLMQQWFVHHPGTNGQAVRPSPLANLPGAVPDVPSRSEWERNQRALRFLMDHTNRAEFLVLQRAVESWLHRPYPHTQPHYEPYLRHIIPDEHWHTPLYPDSALLGDVETLLRVSEFLLEFAEWIGPRVDPRTRALRRRMHRLYLNAGLSIALWSPPWMRPFADGYRHQDLEQPVVPLRLLRPDPKNNHRYWSYLDFLNRRALYHHPDPDAWHAEHRWGLDIGRIVRT